MARTAAVTIRQQRAELARLRAWLGVDALGLSDDELAVMSWEADAFLQVLMGMYRAGAGAGARLA